MKRPPMPVQLNGTTPRPNFRGGILYVGDAAKYLNTTERAVRAKVANHRLPFYRYDGRVVFFRDELEQMLRDLVPCVSVDEARENLARRSGEVAR